MNDTSSTPQFDVSVVIDQLRTLKAKKKEIEEKHEEELKPWNEGIEKISNYLLGWLQSVGSQSFKSAKGTINQIKSTSWRIVDGEAFSNYVKETKDWDIVQWHISKTVADSRWESEKAEMPGTKREPVIKLGVRAPPKPKVKAPPAEGELTDEQWAKIEAQVDKELDEENGQ